MTKDVDKVRHAVSRDMRVRWEAKLQPYTEVIMFSQSILLGHNLAHLVLFLIAFHVVLWGLMDSAQTYLATASFAAMAYVTITFLVDRVGLPWRDLLRKQYAGSGPMRPLGDLVGDGVAVYLDGQDRLAALQDLAEVSRAKYTLIVLALLAIPAILGQLFSDGMVLYLCFMGLILTPAIRTHNIHVVAYRRVEPMVEQIRATVLEHAAVVQHKLEATTGSEHAKKD